jgi:hypothetical protein
MTRPKGCTDWTPSQKETVAKLQLKEELNEKEQNTLNVLMAKKERFNNPELSIAAKKYMITRYSWDKYNRGTLPVSEKASCLVKGNDLEADAIKMLSKRDRTKYIRGEDFVSNDFIFGKCDIYSPDRNKVVDIKVSWGIHSYLPMHITELPAKYWMQMQAYLELYGMEKGEVCWVLLNTPIFLLDRERAKFTEKYMTGEIEVEKFEENMERLELNYDYSKIPNSRKIITFTVDRERGFMEKVYKKVEKCREWMAEFDKLHSDNKRIITLSEKYAASFQEDNTEYNGD